MTQNNESGRWKKSYFPSICSLWDPCWAREYGAGSVHGPGQDFSACSIPKSHSCGWNRARCHFVFPEYLRTSGAIPLSGKAVAAHTALSKKAEIFNNFARVKHASIFETVKARPNRFRTNPHPPAPIQKLMSVPIMDRIP